MSFSASDVKALREKTGAGMMNCKKALTECGGDIEKAVDFLRAKGLAAAAKKQSRVAAEGVVVAQVEGNTGVLLEVNCETDFVSKGDDFKGFANETAALVLKNNIPTAAALKETRTEDVNELTLKIGEKIDLRRLERANITGNGKVGAYVHTGKIGVLIEFNTESNVNDNNDFNEFVKNVCMHVAATDPKFINASDIDEDFKKREAEVYEAQLKEQGKPEKMIPNIIKGKLNKLASEVCLLEQKFVMDPDLTIGKLTEQVSKTVGTGITISNFHKFTLGEGIEKKVDNLADEVAKMTQK